MGYDAVVCGKDVEKNLGKYARNIAKDSSACAVGAAMGAPFGPWGAVIGSILVPLFGTEMGVYQEERCD